MASQYNDYGTAPELIPLKNNGGKDKTKCKFKKIQGQSLLVCHIQTTYIM